MITPSRLTSPFPTLRFAGALVLLTAGTAAMAAAWLAGLGHADQLPPALLTAAVCLGGSLAALGPMRRNSRISLERTVMACLTSMLVRIFTALLGGLLLVYAVGMDVRPVAGWILFWYLLLLVVEMSLLVRYFGSLSSAWAGDDEGTSSKGGEVHPCSH